MSNFRQDAREKYHLFNFLDEARYTLEIFHIQRGARHLAEKTDMWFATLLKGEMERRRVSQVALAEELEVDPAQLSRWLRGQNANLGVVKSVIEKLGGDLGRALPGYDPVEDALRLAEDAKKRGVSVHSAPVFTDRQLGLFERLVRAKELEAEAKAKISEDRIARALSVAQQARELMEEILPDGGTRK